MDCTLFSAPPQNAINLAGLDEASPSQAAMQLIDLLNRKRSGDDFDLATYLNPSLKNMLGDPLTIDGMAQALSMLTSAMKEERRIFVVSDYDADGVTSASIMGLTFRALGVKTESIVIPDRFKDGHGLSANMVEQIVAAKPDLLLILDFGTTATSAVEQICAGGTKVISADHHHADMKPLWPEGAVLLNPGVGGGMKPDADPVFAANAGNLCAAGLSFLLCVALRKELGRKDLDLFPQLALAALGTVADMVPMHGLNRAIVRQGLPHFPKVTGLRAIAENAGVEIYNATAKHCGFVFGPTLNAAGRVRHAGLALDLMLEEDEDVAKVKAAELVEINLHRKQLQIDVVSQALAAKTNDDAGIVLYNPAWHRGVIGLAASKLLEKTGRPSLVIGEEGVGSGRAPSNFHLGDFIAKAREAGLLAIGGGHAAAAGFRLAPGADSFEKFKAFFNAETAGIRAPEITPEIVINAKIAPGYFNLPFLINYTLAGMEPVGVKNEPPIIEITNAETRPKRFFGKNGDHVAFLVGVGGSWAEICLFNYAERGFLKSEFLYPRRVARILGTIEPGYPNSLTSPGRISATDVRWADA